MSRTEAESRQFPRCPARNPAHGGRCWLLPAHEGKHLTVKPGEIPSIATVERVAAARPDAPYGYVCMVVNMEPIGKIGAMLDHVAAGGRFDTAADMEAFARRAGGAS